MCVALVLLSPVAAGSDLNEFKIKRRQVFEFTEAPSATRQGDMVTVTFTSKGFCDATVAIENAEGRIVRHLACGVLGKNAPAPLRKDSLKQTLVWDGKDDQGRYVDDKGAVTVRVSLGLKPQFERTLSWTPYKRVANNPPIIKACPEGVLVYEGQIYDMIRLYDHDGNYLRTVYPFPANKVRQIADLHWQTFPQDGKRLPLKEWFRQATLLSSGTNSNHPWRGFGEQRKAHDGHGASAPHHAASAMAVRGDRIALAMHWLNRLATDGSSGGRKMNGPALDFTAIRGGRRWHGGAKDVRVPPSSAAFSPDGRWLYLTGYTWMANFGTGGRWHYWLPGVARLACEGDARPQIFVGSMKKGDVGQDNAHFCVPTAVACDAKGRVYVSDYINDRIQVYSPAGVFLKTIPVRRPAHVAIHARTGEVYVFSWRVNTWWLRLKKETIVPRLVRFGPLEKLGKPAFYVLPEMGRGGDYAAGLDSWSKEPTVWVYPGRGAIISPYAGYLGQARGRAYWQATGIRLLTVKGDKLDVKRDFGSEAAQETLVTRRVTGTNRNLCVNPKTGKLYVGDGSAAIGFSFSVALEIDPRTGRAALVHLPFDAEQMAFDLNGLAYLRAKAKIARYDPEGWREVPWDYGEAHKTIGVAVTRATGPGKKTASALSCLVTPYWEHAPNGVFSIAANGNIVIPIKGKSSVSKSGLVFRRAEWNVLTQSKPYQFRTYPGRSVGGLVAVFDQHGKLIHDDAIPGLTYTHGIKIDKDNNLYAMALGNRVLDGKPYLNPAACTLMKFAPRKGRIVGTHNKAVPVPLTPENKPKRPPDLRGGGKTGLHAAWAEGAEWLYGGVGYNGEHHRNPDYGCDCCYSSFDLDYFARSFAPEVGHCSVAVLDSSGNLILRVGTYGNVDDGKPLIAKGGPANPRPMGGDEVALFYAPHLAVHTDRRLFIADVGNERIVSVKLGYHTTETVALKDVLEKK